MVKYEIMLIIDPKEDIKIVENLANKIFDNPKIKKLERTELSYEINKSKIAQYIQINVIATTKQIKELNRKTNLSKKIWRILIINLEKEIGKDKSIKLITKRSEQLDNEQHNKYSLQKKEKMHNNGIKKVSNDETTPNVLRMGDK